MNRDAHVAATASPHVVFGLDGPREILDACCGGRMWWWDKEHPCKGDFRGGSNTTGN